MTKIYKPVSHWLATHFEHERTQLGHPVRAQHTWCYSPMLQHTAECYSPYASPESSQHGHVAHPQQLLQKLSGSYL